MPTMRFMSTLPTQATKVFKFDSSPGRAIAQALGAGLWDEKSYKSELKESLPGGEEVYEVFLRHNPPRDRPTEVMPLLRVGMIHYTPVLTGRPE
jgi:hypothetical protein